MSNDKRLLLRLNDEINELKGVVKLISKELTPENRFIMSTVKENIQKTQLDLSRYMGIE